MRLLFYLLALISVLAGILFGALNDAAVHIDLYLVQFDLMVGVALLLAMLLGAVLAWLLLALGVIWPLKRRVKKAERQTQAIPTSVAESTTGSTAA